MFEKYMNRVYPNLHIDYTSNTEPKKKGRVKKGRPEISKDNFYPLSAEEKSNICSHEIDVVLAELARISEEGDDEISEVRSAGHQCCRFSRNSAWAVLLYRKGHPENGLF